MLKILLQDTHRSILHYIAAVSACDALDSLLKKHPKLDLNCR